MVKYHLLEKMVKLGPSLAWPTFRASHLTNERAWTDQHKYRLGV
jgi:hypothetical protein